MKKLEKTLNLKPVFIPRKSLTEDQLNDPDYRIKQLKKLYNVNYVSCSGCHHCR